MTDSEKLRTLVLWFDKQDSIHGIENQNEVQKDLLRIADAIDQSKTKITELYGMLNAKNRETANMEAHFASVGYGLYPKETYERLERLTDELLDARQEIKRLTQ